MKLNTIVPKSTVKNNEPNTAWDNLLALSRFAGSSLPERQDAIQEIQEAIKNMEMRDWQRNVLEEIMVILRINPSL
jgi:hypothetical protein